MMRFTLALFLFVASRPVLAETDKQRITALEVQVKALSAVVQDLQTRLDAVRKGGFTITPVVNCEIRTASSNEVYTSSELSRTAAQIMVSERCKEKASVKADCDISRAVCK